MRKFLLFVVVLLILTEGGQCGKSISRRKRFLDSHSLSILPESLLRWGEEAEQFGETLTSHVSRTLDDLLQEGIRLRDRINQATSAKRIIPEVGETSKKQIGNSEIEKEDFEPVETAAKPPQSSVTVEIPQSPLLPNPFFQGAVLQNPLFSFGFFTPWWKGPNVCVDRSEVEESEENASNFTSMSFSFESTQCVPTESAYVCTKRTRSNGVKKTSVIRHQCCHGFIRRTDGRPGCSQLKMDNLIDTMNDLGATRFAHAIETFGLKEKVLSGNYTIFCPTNEAMIDFEDETEDNEINLDRRIERRSVSDKASVVSGHIAEGFHNYDILDNEQIVHSINGKQIRINKYHGPNSVFTANCVPVTTKNHFATNGILHFVPEVVQFPTKSIMDIINSDAQFSILRELLSKSEMDEDLKSTEKAWTFFAPTDNAFNAMDQSMLKDMLEGKRCVKSTVKQHMVQSTICSSAVSGRIHVQNVLENRLVLTRDEDENIQVEGKSVLEKNILGTNGVIHVIDSVLIPPQAKTILEALEDAGRSDLLDLIESANLIPTFKKFENVTFFAPCKDAIKEVSNSTLAEWQENPSKLRDALLYHVTIPKTAAFAFQNNQQLTSMLNNKTIHIRLHEAFPGIVTSATAQCARVVSSDNEACGAYVHLINKVLVPPKQNIFTTLETMEGYDTFRKLVQSNGLEDRLKESGPLTLLAPSDEAFSHLKETGMDELLENKTKAEEILRMHILPEMLCCSGVSHISPLQRQYVRTDEGSLLPLHRNFHNRVRFGHARAVTCDIMAENGIIHTINRVLLPPKRVLFDFGLLGFF